MKKKSFFVKYSRIYKSENIFTQLCPNLTKISESPIVGIELVTPCICVQVDIFKLCIHCTKSTEIVKLANS